MGASGVTCEVSRRCTKCSDVKDVTEFPKAKRNRGGLSLWCKRCYAERQREAHLRRAYGITRADFDQMLAAQNGRCAMPFCGATEPRGPGTWHVDHCHTTGRIRGLLCSPCNIRLGVAEAWFLPNYADIAAYRGGV